MENKELRIGNWVKINEIEFEVYKFDSFDECKLDNEALDRSMSNVRIPALDPIVLTEEWLLKFGFTKDDDTKEFYRDIFGVSLDHELNGVIAKTPLHIWDGSFTGAPCMYVHQLQNLYFALTGEELLTTPSGAK